MPRKRKAISSTPVKSGYLYITLVSLLTDVILKGVKNSVA